MPPLKPDARTRYWRTLDELVGTPEFQDAVRREFPSDDWDRLPETSRRQFLKVMGASIALAGVTACRWPEEEIVPFAYRPAERVPGVPRRFATAMERDGAALGMVVTSFDGRPVKAEGNPRHPDSLGALPAVGQALVLGLYDPDRSREPALRQAGDRFTKGWDEAIQALRGGLVGSGAGVAVLAEPSSSPTLARKRDRLLSALPDARWYEYAPLSDDVERDGTRLLFGQPLRAHPQLDRTRVVLSLDADPFQDHPAAIANARAWSEARQPGRSDAPRLWAVESSWTLTGIQADERIAAAPSEIRAVLARLGAGLGVEAPWADPVASLPAAAAELVDRLVEDLAAHRGEALIVTGRRQPAEVHAAVAALNLALAAVGRTVRYTAAPDPDRPSHLESIRELAERIRAGDVQTLLILGGNPAYDAPADLGFAELVASVETSFHLALGEDETSLRSTWHLPAAHPLESWSDGRAWDGTVTMVQPLIAPLYGGRTAAELIALALGDEPVKGYDLVRETAGELLPGGFSEEAWRRALNDGIIAGTAAQPVQPRSSEGAQAELGRRLAGTPATPAEAIELVLTTDEKVGDGRWANNAWLQELPQAVSKICWDNALWLAPSTARRLGVVDGDLVQVSAPAGTLEAPVTVVPGQASRAAALAVGYGRTAAGVVGTGVGVNAYLVRTTDYPQTVPVRLAATGGHRRMASTQDHHLIDDLGFAARNRRSEQLVREVTYAALERDPDVVHRHSHHPPLLSLWKEHEYEGEQWGMAIDLNACTGCNACVVACQAENNVPVVGREGVLNQREMHWLRVDRYFGTPAELGADEVDDASVAFMPMACVHCENAPCEQVCPVGATMHTPDGLNAMVYNRCIGTRYCSNNCQFKVRRFNFFDYTSDSAGLRQMQYNPEVTVRSRGVMEKCTYCVQRIETARIRATNERRPLTDGEIVPACAQTCPTRAIVFGDLNDPESEISGLRDEGRGYVPLAELNIKPRTHYLARLRKPVSAEDDGGAGGGSGGDQGGGDGGHGGEA